MEQSMDSDNDMMKQQFAAMGNMKMSVYFKDGKSSSELSNAITGDITAIMNMATKETLMLMNNPMLGKVYAKTSTDVDDEKLENVKITETGETKDILGYKCKLYNVTMSVNGIDTVSKFYMTEDIKVPHQQTAAYGDKMKGFPMHMEVAASQMGINFTVIHKVTEIKKESVDASKFDMTIPEGYTENTMILGKN